MFYYLEESVTETMTSQLRIILTTMQLACTLAVRLGRGRLVIKVIGYGLDWPGLVSGSRNKFSFHHVI
jgi:hypothetical protein